MKLSKRFIEFYEDFAANYFQKKYEKIFRKIYKFSKYSYRIENTYRNQLHKCHVSNKEAKQIKHYWKNYTKDFKLISHKFYRTSNGTPDCRFIPDDIYAEYIEQHFNNIKLANAFCDKNYFDLYLKGFSLPTTYIHLINNVFLNRYYQIISEKEAEKILLSFKSFVVKKSISSSGGTGVIIVDKINKKLLKELFNQLKDGNYIFQEYIKQCSTLSKFNTSSLNTIRIVSLMYKDKIFLSNATLRVGIKGSKVDNASSGGIFYQINEDDTVYPIPMNLDGYKQEKIESKCYKENTKLSFMQDVRNLVIKAAQRFPHFQIIAWDIAIRQNNSPVIIEYNLANTIPDMTQMSGKPLFGDLTDEILNEVFKSDNKEKPGLNTNEYI